LKTEVNFPIIENIATTKFKIIEEEDDESQLID